MKDLISVKESMAIIGEVWKKYPDYTSKWKAQRIVHICNTKIAEKLLKRIESFAPKKFVMDKDNEWVFELLELWWDLGGRCKCKECLMEKTGRKKNEL